MPKRVASSAPDELIQQLMPLRDDPGKVYEALAKQDAATVGEVVAKLLRIAVDVEQTETAKRRKLVENRPSVPAEIFDEVARFVDRDTLDCMQLACRSMHSFVTKMETDQLALRPISEVLIAATGPYIIRELRCQDAIKMQLDFECNLAMFRFMRLAYCRSVIIKFGVLRSTDPHLASDFVAAVPQFQTALERFFVDSIAHEVAVDSLQVACRTEKIAKLVPHCVMAFKSVTTVELDASHFGRGRPEAFTTDFFASLSRKGVRTVDVMMPGIDVDVGPALAFGFAEPASGGRRQLTGVRCANGADFLEQVRKKASELDGGNSFEFEFSIMNLVGDIEPAGSEKYQTDGGKWLIDDLENRVTMDVEKTEETVEIKVRSSQ